MNASVHILISQTCFKRPKAYIKVNNLLAPLLLFSWLCNVTLFAKAQWENRVPIRKGSRLFAPPVDPSLRGNLVKIDPDEQNLRASWRLVYIDAPYSISPTRGTFDDTWQWNLYRDVKAIHDLRVPITTMNSISDTESGSLYRVDDITLPPIAIFGQRSSKSVDTDITFTHHGANDALFQTLFGYPFDVWTSSVVFVLTDRITAERANLSNSFVVRIHSILTEYDKLRWDVSLNTTNTCEDPDPNAGCELHVDFLIRRSGPVKFAAMMAVIGNWTITFVIIYQTYRAVMRLPDHLSETNLILVCISALSIVSFLRSIIPGAPDHGVIIDLIGVIPNIMLISLCTIAIAVSGLTGTQAAKKQSNGYA
ncbi:hypothetical protein FRC14_006359 [Serendipita sp. 396]|nr:hypothetical protein FRC14_006359 [Serendipita sp. 396]KAG8783187.1 hypothetical protein FRC15_005682 [Serendipita sp. 397]KAG8799083.1 hypothetical protein FRC16_005852 [Serendipita sp. 398]KAG8817486.1 hypothetical protein FRC19_011315 [Serendipita sp. 401]KAG8830886.1 hypothetical protein FRC18_007416 [Serendipita sp. 400]KAG8851957.1 hypothetical protein FRB91_007123 [Serendipita sp. 411]KAG8867490.1 hypothetical protein FRC20_005614 [Serendipita sp. 405]KAG9053341.1 hypothetical prot